MITCCNYFYINVKWPLTCILIGIKAHLLEDKQIPSVRVFDKDLFDAFLGSHLSPKSWFYDQILPQIVSFLILGTWDMISGNRSILDVFELKSEETTKSKKPVRNCTWRRQALIADAVTWRQRSGTQTIPDALWRNQDVYTWQRQVLQILGHQVYC